LHDIQSLALVYRLIGLSTSMTVIVVHFSQHMQHAIFWSISMESTTDVRVRQWIKKYCKFSVKCSK